MTSTPRRPRVRPVLAAAIGALAIGLAAPAPADTSAGSYLAGLVAQDQNDFGKAAEFFSRALLADPQNTALMEAALHGYVGIGRFDRALPLAERLADAGVPSQLGSVVRVEELAGAGRWDDLLAALDGGGLSVAPLLDGLVRGWAQIGAGRMSDGLASFDRVAANPTTRAFGLYHKALALALAGDYEAADAILSEDGPHGLSLTRRGAIARAEILSQLEKNDLAVKSLADAFGTDLDPGLQLMKERLQAGKTLPMTVVTSPADGLAEVFFTVGVALNGESPDAFTLAFTRAAEALQPGHVDAILLSAAILERLGRYDLAIATYDQIPAGSDYSYVAEVGRAEALRRDGKTAEAIEVLQGLSQKYDRLPSVFVTLGDALRREERFAEAARAYDRAIQLFGPPQKEHWLVHFSRGICEEREGNWDRAEADLRMALQLQPDQPQVLNYLGYSFVEQKRNLDEALAMIEKAVNERPDDGYITDSLGWAFYRLGRYDEAVAVMEKAVELTPVDPVINDHLGDVYWAVGRRREAEFQWHRAMSFDPEEKDADRIRRKLAVGLDAVLKEEGAEPLAVAVDR